MYVIEKGNIVKIELINKGYDNSLILLENKRVYYENSNLIDSYEKAKLAKKEYEIVKRFKKRNCDKDGFLKCTCCGKKARQLTVDHIKPLYGFGGKQKIRENKHIWEKAWDNNNLQILCENCNHIKNTMNNNIFNKYIKTIDEIGNKLKMKKINNMSRCRAKTENQSLKPGFCISSVNKKMSQEVAMRLAKMDSRILYRKEGYKLDC